MDIRGDLMRYLIMILIVGMLSGCASFLCGSDNATTGQCISYNANVLMEGITWQNAK